MHSLKPYFNRYLMFPCYFSVQCSIMVQENHSVVQSESRYVYTAMLQSWRALLYRIFSVLRRKLLHENSGLHTAVLENWAGFNPDIGSR